MVEGAVNKRTAFCYNLSSSRPSSAPHSVLSIKHWQGWDAANNCWANSMAELQAVQATLLKHCRLDLASFRGGLQLFALGRLRTR